MNLLGGVVYRDAERRVEPALLRAMAARVPGASEPVAVTAGPAGFFTTGAGKPPKRRGGVITAADLDLVNFDELRALTGLPGSCAVLARLHELEGWQGISRLRGAFGVALWDERHRALVLAVDHFGMKRLHYAITPEALAFASQPSALRAVPGVTGSVDPEAVYAYLNFGYVPAPSSMFAGVRRLPPGSVLLVRGGEPAITRYWDLSYQERHLGLAEASAATVQLVEEAVSLALRDAPVKETGAFLSGGTDSSTVVGLMTKVTGERVNAFSIGFREAKYDELHYAGLAARHFDAAHHTRLIMPDEALGVLPRLVERYDEPFGNSSAIGTYFCAKLARECGVTRLLAGDGGDEIFGGNERYRTDRIFARYHQLPSPLRRWLLEPVLLGLPDLGGSLLGKGQRYIQRANLPNPRRFYSYEFFFAHQGCALLSRDFTAAIDAAAPWAVLHEHFARAEATSELNRLLYLDMKLTIGDNDLLKVTRTADLAGVDVRFPLLDRALVEFTGTLPAHYKVRGLEKRYLFKRAFRPLLPPEILAKQKHGFGVPTGDWLRDHPGFRELARETLLSARARQRGYFAPGAVERLFELHAADSTPYYGAILWTLLMLELWHRRHADEIMTA